MKKLTDEMRNEVYKACGSHILSEIERTIREFNINGEGANQAANRITRGEKSELPEDQILVLQLQNYVWRNTAAAYFDNLNQLLAFVEKRSPTLAIKLREHIGSSIISSVPNKGTSGG